MVNISQVLGLIGNMSNMQGSLMLNGDSSTDLTLAKRTRPPIINLEEAFDQNSVTRMACTIKVKKEKIDGSG